MGVLVLSAGVGNDVVGWILLALTVALVNASTGLVALYVLLTGVGFALFLLLPVKWAYVWLARWSGSLETGHPTTMMTTITLVIVAISAFFTDVIGIHPIFGESIGSPDLLAGYRIPTGRTYDMCDVSMNRWIPGRFDHSQGERLCDLTGGKI